MSLNCFLLFHCFFFLFLGAIVYSGAFSKPFGKFNLEPGLLQRSFNSCLLDDLGLNNDIEFNKRATKLEETNIYTMLSDLEEYNKDVFY